MVSRQWFVRSFLGRDVTVAFAVIIALYYLRFVRIQPLQIPAYLLIVAYDLVEVAVPFLTPFHPVAFPVFLYLLAVVAAGVARRLRTAEGDGSGWMEVVGGVSLIVGILSLLFGGYVGGPIVSPTDNPTPLAITGATGVVLVVLGWWLLGRPMGRSLPVD